MATPYIPPTHVANYNYWQFTQMMSVFYYDKLFDYDLDKPAVVQPNPFVPLKLAKWTYTLPGIYVYAINDCNLAVIQSRCSELYRPSTLFNRFMWWLGFTKNSTRRIHKCTY
jgi:hypothetical protein